MREAIERVIDDLQARHNTCLALNNHDRADAFEVAINLLKEVLATEITDTR